VVNVVDTRRGQPDSAWRCLVSR